MKTDSNESIKVPVILASVAALVLLCLAAVSPTGGGGSVTPVVVSASTGNSYTSDATLGSLLTFRLICTTNFTLANPTGGTDGQSIIWEFQQDSTNGQHTITLGANFALGSDITAIVLTTNVNKRDFMSARFNSASNLWYVLSFARGY